MVGTLSRSVRSSDCSAWGLAHNSPLCESDVGFLVGSVFVAAITTSRVRHFQAVNNQFD